MCTVSWLPSRNGYWLFVNRDERLTRAPAIGPRRRWVGGVRVLAPTDATARGTWVGVNEFGVAATLLNRYEEAPELPPPGIISRGLLLTSVLDGRSAVAIMDRLAAVQLSSYQPFTIVAVDARGRCLSADWNGRQFVPGSRSEPGLVRTSSGRDQIEAERRRALAVVSLTGGSQPSRPAFEALHRSHLPERGPFSVCMHREEAATRSLTVVRVGGRRATVWYWGGPPCQRPVVTQRVLPRRP